ncbi:transmembrane 9 superfamily member 2-like isoform X2 [Oryx dammah]|uniref:transmembrane 9 superfamily member 2-like isoform X2 n=1 Tax=Oryx dammah TaxID=59534 RepID=UPI001A9B7E11|nr:transmembrane 9 superfamily member 2-like isoform X2 [Oryx dammah]
MSIRVFCLGTNPWSLWPTLLGLRGLLVMGLILGLQTTSSNAFYLPGLAPVNFCEVNGETNYCQSSIEMYVNRLDSVESVLPYEYNTFDFCHDFTKQSPSENLGQVLFGERITSSPYEFSFNKSETCVKVCMKSYDTAKEDQKKKLDFLKRGMQLNYQHHWIIDNMPVVWCRDINGGNKYCTTGFPIGCFVTQSGVSSDACFMHPEFNKTNTYYIFNHVDITISYHSENEVDWYVSKLVSARLEPKSYKHVDENHLTCNGTPMEIPGDYTDKLNITYTYSVKFEENKQIRWGSRWGYILMSMSHTSIQWFSILNSFVVVLFLTGMVAMIILRTLRKDIIRYNQDDIQKDYGWKLVHGDVFRPPRHGMLLSILLGQGTQVLIMTFTTLSFRGLKWKTNFLLTALLCPGVVFVDIFIMNLILWIEGSSSAISFGTLIGILALWFGISVPLTFLGSYIGSFQKFDYPVSTNQIPRRIPHQDFIRRPLFSIIIGGILPFGCIFIQLFFILNSIWSHQMYIMFGFLFLVFIILLITCSEATILLCYFHLCSEDYHWWWRAFFTSSFTAVYFFAYAVYYFFARLKITGIASTILYFGYTMIMVLIFFLFTGTIGFFSCFIFISKIYSVVKVD